MAIQENEQLFLDLTVFDGLSDLPVADGTLRVLGPVRMDEEKENTDKAEAFIDDFVHSRADEIIKTLEEQGSYFKDKGHVMYHAGLKSLMAMEVVMEHLANHMVIKRKRNGDYIKRNGINTP